MTQNTDPSSVERCMLWVEEPRVIVILLIFRNWAAIFSPRMAAPTAKATLPAEVLGFGWSMIAKLSQYSFAFQFVRDFEHLFKVKA